MNKKILLLIDCLGAGGAQRQLVGLAGFLQERGYVVELVCYHPDAFYANLLSQSNVPYVYLAKAHNSLRRTPVVARYIRQSKPDVVIAFLETPSIVACLSHFFNKRFKLIVSERNTTQHIGGNERVRFKLFELADFLVPNAYAQERFVKDNFPKLSNKTMTVPNFVDLENFVPTMHVRRKTPEIMIAASIWASKNTLGFIDAVKILHEKGCDFHISWYGKNQQNADYVNQCQAKIDEYGLNNVICLLDKTKRIKEKYQDADYFCLPSFYEGTPNVICESMACGLPIICSDVCDNGIYVHEGENGFLFDPHSPDDMADGIEKALLMDEKRYQEYCLSSRRIAEKLLSKDVFVQRYIDLIEK